MYRRGMSDTFALVGRILLSCIFLVSAYAKVAGWNTTVQLMDAKGIPFASVLLGMATVIEFLGGLSILLGVFSKLGSAIVFLYLIPVSLIFHSFWSVSPDQVHIQLVNFLKNLSIMGGLVMLAAYGPGRYSVGKEKRLYDSDYDTMPEKQEVPVSSSRT